MKTANLRLHDRDRHPIGVARIRDQQVRDAIREYDSAYPLNDYPRTAERPHLKTWLERGNHHFVLRYRGRCYPPKQILRLAIGSGSMEYHFFGGKRHANRVLEQLGFEVIDKSAC